MASLDTVQTNYNNTGGTFSSLATAAGYNLASTGKFVVVAIRWETASGTATVTDTAGNTYTALTKRQSNAINQWTQLFYCLSTTATNASNLWTMNVPAGSQFGSLAVFVFTKGGTVALVDEDNGTGTGTALSTAAFTAGQIALSAASDNSGSITTTPGTGWTEGFDEPNIGFHVFYRTDSPGGTIAGDATLSSSAGWGMVGASFSEAAGSAKNAAIAYYKQMGYM